MDLEKFWLGNVNEKGDVDQEGYDEETLQTLNTKVQGLKQKLVDERVVDENDTQPQDTDGDDMPVEKEATAVDYSHENEAVEDDTTAEELEERERNYRRAELAFINSTRGGPSTEVAKRKIDDDYDDEESESEEKAHQGEEQKLATALEPAGTDTAGPRTQQENASAHASASAASNAAGQPQPPAPPSGQASSQAAAGPSVSLEPASAAAGEGQPPPPPPPEPPSKADSIRKHGLLLFSEMFLFPAIQPRIARSRCSPTGPRALLPAAADGAAAGRTRRCTGTARWSTRATTRSGARSGPRAGGGREREREGDEALWVRVRVVGAAPRGGGGGGSADAARAWRPARREPASGGAFLWRRRL